MKPKKPKKRKARRLSLPKTTIANSNTKQTKRIAHGSGWDWLHTTTTTTT